MLFSHVYGSCWTVWSGFAIFPQKFLLNHLYPIHVWNMVASNVHISLSFIVRFIVFIHGLFHFLVPFNSLFIFIFFHVFSFFSFFIFFIFFHFVSFFHFLFFSWKNITHLNHLHVDPRLSSAETWLFERPKKMNNDWLVVSTIVYSPFHIWDVILPDG